MEGNPLPREDRESMLKHRHERNLQILLPVLVVVALVVVVAALIVGEALAQNPQLRQWADTALIVVLSIMMALMVILLLVITALSVLMFFTLKETPEYTGRFSEQLLHYSALSRLYMDKATEPLIEFKTWLGVAGDFLGRRKAKDS
jgi:NADH:ubiquinone oxidoreductase subunit 5 (subunit L)/multisubunit Na+/H+ antiporter MnhA subunit